MTSRSTSMNVARAEGVCEVQFGDTRLLDEIHVTELQQELLALVDREPGIRLLINMSAIAHISSAGLGMLSNVQKRVNAKQGRLKLCGLQPKVLEVFKSTRLHQVFEIYPDTASARVAFGSKPTAH